MGIPVVTVASGGLAVTESPLGIPIIEAANGYGIAVTFVDKGGMAVNVESGPNPPEENTRVTNTGDVRVTNTGDTRTSNS